MLPQVYPQIRLPVYAVLAFSLSVVDVALILGPGNPPTLAVLAVRWFADADIALLLSRRRRRRRLLLALVVAAIAAWHGSSASRSPRRPALARARRRARAVRRRRRRSRRRCGLPRSWLVALAIAGMALWSIAAQWRFPDALPEAWSLANWTRQLDGARRRRVHDAGASARSRRCSRWCSSLGCLENEARTRHRAGPRALWLLYLPLLVPQVAFLFGAQVLLVRAGLDGTLAAVVWAHLVFVLPYLFLSLADPWRALDPRYARTRGEPRRVAVRACSARVKLPILLASAADRLRGRASRSASASTCRRCSPATAAWRR